jgi:hypothetical protein
MKRLVIVVAAMMFASAVFAGEASPDRSHVKLSKVPRQCLENGTATSDGYKYTCTKVDSSDVWNELEANSFGQDIFKANRQPTETADLGLVVRQDSQYTTMQAVPNEQNEVAVVETRNGFKYRYTHR